MNACGGSNPATMLVWQASESKAIGLAQLSTSR